MPFILFVLLLNSFGSPALHAAEKIRISVSGGYNMIFLSAGVAQHKGFFRNEGLDADIVVMGAAPSIAALSNGDIDFTLLTGTVIRAAIRGLPVRLVAGLMTSSPHVLLARPEIKSVKDLSGKKVGLAGFGDATTSPGENHLGAQRRRPRQGRSIRAARPGLRPLRRLAAETR
ncbi:MAG: ABC transporter substrate-binding protein [Candidatus Binatia bacterium]